MKIPFLFVLALLLAGGGLSAHAATPPQVGDAAPNFTLKTLDGKSVELQSLNAQGTVVLVMLRGWPGYQCPICTKQVQDYAAHAGEFTARKARVVMVYPGPAEQLQAHAAEFLRSKQWPSDFVFVIDPDYSFTNTYGLRWDAPKETAYPSTFVIDRNGKVRFAQISKTHGGRVDAAKALAQLP